MSAKKAMLAWILLSLACFLLSRLVFAPVPWPDGSAFYLPGLDLVHWPPAWKMHAQAAFVPSYDQANFNLMPALPLLLGIAARSGLLQLASPPLLIKAVSLIALGAWAYLLWAWLAEMATASGLRRSKWLAPLVATAALWDPIVRWGTLVVRTETWIGLCWVWILRELWRWESAEEAQAPSHARWNRSAWSISAGLATAAYFHFEAVYLVPAVVVGLGFRGHWFKRLLGISARTTLLLSPWLAYVLLHFGLFVEQMEIQFFRLSHGNHWVSTPYLFFHSLFLDHGSPAGWPKYFNLAKAAFWVLIALLSARSVTAVSVDRRSRIPLAAAMAFFACLYLWISKAEVWFVAFCHLAFWPWACLVLGTQDARRWSSRATVALVSLYGILAIGATEGQRRAISPSYTWNIYSEWVDCLERAIGPAGGRPGFRLWQPHVPDALAELSSRRPSWDLTRALDFPSRMDLALEAAARMDAVVFSRSFNPRGEEAPRHEGSLRDEDRRRLENGSELPFGPWGLREIDRGTWRTRVCEQGPFWSVILVKDARTPSP